MMKLIIWGMGKTAKRFQRYLRKDRAEIIAFTCSDVAEVLYKGGIIRPEDITKRAFDYVIVASSAYREIENSLIQLGVSKDKIHQVYDRKKYANDDVIREITQWNFTCSNCEYEIGKYRIDLGYGHMLPQYQMEYPMYDRFLGELSKCLQSDKWAIDIGANVGDSVFLLKAHSNIQVLAVEPIADYYELLCKNVVQLSEVYTEKCMISLHDKKQYRMIKHDGTGFAEGIACDMQNVISAITLKNLLKIKKIDPKDVQMIKIDTDDFDAECIMSLDTMISQINGYIYFENFFKNQEVHDQYDMAYEYLDKNGYKHFFIFDNFGNYLCEGNVTTIKAVNDYLMRAQKGCSAKTIDYIDVLTVSDALYENTQKVIDRYVKIFDEIL